MARIARGNVSSTSPTPLMVLNMMGKTPCVTPNTILAPGPIPKKRMMIG